MQISAVYVYARGSHADTVPVKNVFLHVTKACNRHCGYCYFSASQPLPNEMTRMEFSRLWTDIVALRPQKVVFTGGEPLLRPDLLDLLRDFRATDPEHYIVRCLNTNGDLVTPEIAHGLVGLADEIRVSLDALPERNDTLRGKGSFDAAVRALGYFHAVGFEPKVLVTVTSISVPDLDELLCFLIHKGITRINLNLFRPIGHGVSHPDWATEPSEVDRAVRSAWKECCQEQPLPRESANPTSHTNCGVGSFLSIMPNGNVFPCHALMVPEFRCGNVREQRLSEICDRGGLLRQLKTLNFHQLAHQDKQLAALNGSNMCMGLVYAKTKSLPIWSNSLPLSA